MSMIKVFIDGASAGDPGPSGVGIFINYGDGQVEQLAIPIGSHSNHEAEFQALLHALKLGIERAWSNVAFHTDSQLVDRALEKNYVKNTQFQAYLQEAQQLIAQFDLFFMKWVPSKENKMADELARKAIRMNKL